MTNQDIYKNIKETGTVGGGTEGNPINIIESIHCLPPPDKISISLDTVNEDETELLHDPIGFFRRKCLENLPFLMNKFLGFDYFDPRYPYIKRISEFICQPNPNKLIVLPRSHQKTSLGIGYIIQDILKNPQHSWLIESETDELSKKIYMAVKEGFETDEMNMLWGDLRGDLWTQQHGLKISYRIKSARNKEPNVYFTSVTSSSTGEHPTHYWADDIMGESNFNTPDTRQQTIDHYQRMLLVVTEGILFTATRWHFDDVVNFILNYNKEVDPTNPEYFLVMYESVKNKFGEPLFPEKRNRDWISMMRTKLGSFMFESQLMNNPIDPEDLIFPPTTIEPYIYNTLTELIGDDPHNTKKRLNIVITDDPSSPTGGKHSHTDYTALMVCGIDENHHIYVLEYKNQRFKTTTEHISTLIDLYLKWQQWSISPVKVGMEKGAYEKMMKENLDLQKKEKNIYFKVHAISYKDNRVGAGKSKHAHYISIQSYFELGMVHIRKDMTELIDQLISITYRSLPSHDDLADALSFVFRLVKPPTPLTIQKEKTWRDRYKDKIRSRWMGNGKGMNFMKNYINEGVRR